MKNRITWLDIARIFAIFMVVLTHMLYLPKGALQNFWVLFFYLLVPTCVPLFVMVSGALLLPKSDKTKTFFKKRLKKILLPWVAWTIIYTGLSIYFKEYSFHFSFQGAHFLAVQFLSRLWFFKLIFLLYLITPLLRVFVKHASKWQIFYFVSLWFIFVICKSLFDVLNGKGFQTPQIAEFVGYYVLGYFLQAVKFPRFTKYLIAIFSLVSMSIAAILSLLSTTLTENKYLYNYESPFVVILTICIFIAFILKFRSFDDTAHITTRKLITTLSQASLGIYVVHELIIKFFSSYLVKLNLKALILFPIPTTILEIFLIFLTSFLLVIVLKKIPYIKYLVP